MYYGRKAQPKANKRMYDLEVERRMKAMKDRIASMKPSVDNRTPKGFGDNRRNVKKEQMLEERYAHIEHENRVLLARMSDIMTKPGVETSSSSWQYGRSLNKDTRKKELQRITEENQKILERIQNARPQFDFSKADEEAIDHARLVESITEYRARPIGGSMRHRRARSEGGTRRGGAGGQSQYEGGLDGHGSFGAESSMYDGSFLNAPGLGPQPSLGPMSMGQGQGYSMQGMGVGGMGMGGAMMSGPGITQGVYSGLPGGYAGTPSGYPSGMGMGFPPSGYGMGPLPTSAGTTGSYGGAGPVGGWGMGSMGLTGMSRPASMPGAPLGGMGMAGGFSSTGAMAGGVGYAPVWSAAAPGTAGSMYSLGTGTTAVTGPR